MREEKKKKGWQTELHPKGDFREKGKNPLHCNGGGGSKGPEVREEGSTACNEGEEGMHRLVTQGSVLRKKGETNFSAFRKMILIYHILNGKKEVR